jgi:arabinogalactan endo-1,4-beta-galactosidase
MSVLRRCCLFLVIGTFLGAAAGCGGDGESGTTGGSGGTTTGTTSATGGQGGSGGSGGQGGTGGQEPFRIALSVSPFTGVLLQSGASFTDGALVAKDAESFEKLYMAHGANELYARISTERKKTAAPDDHSLQTALDRAALAKKLGMPFNPELGLWAHYGDITCEPGPDFTEFPDIMLPGPWPSLTVDQMATALHAYGADVAKDILATGATIDFWDIGNEIDLGTAGVAPKGVNCSTPWAAPDGVDPEIGKQTVFGVLMLSEADRIAWLGAHVWPHEAKLLAAVADGIRSVDPGARFATHMSQSNSSTYALAFYQAMTDGGFKVDRIGFSYYPSSNDGADRVKHFEDTATAVHDHFGKPVFIAEVAYPAGPIPDGAYSTWTHAIPKYPVSEDGQAAFFHDLASWAAASGLAGIRPWAPEVYLSGWKGFALFDADKGLPAKARKALSAVADGAAKPDAAAFTDQ